MRGEFWDAVTQNPYVCGQFLWTGIDYLGEAGRWPARSNGAGLLDLAGFAKSPNTSTARASGPKSQWCTSAPEPSQRARDPARSGATRRPNPSGAARPVSAVRVVCFTNCAAAELTLRWPLARRQVARGRCQTACIRLLGRAVCARNADHHRA